VRIAEVDHGRTIYVDLGGPSSDVVEVTKAGWRVVGEAPVRFFRPGSMLPMPAPVRGGSLDELWRVLNVVDKASRTLLLAWFASVYRESIPCPLLFVHGEQGSAKSTLTRIAHTLVDPSSTMLRSLPKDVHQLAIAAGDARVISMDNLSSIRRETSDALCKLVTGASFPVRRFYSDSEERVFAGRRAMILNGIPDLAGFPDLAGRSLTLVLPRIGNADRRTERELHAMFEDMRPRLLGALLDVVSEGLRREAGPSEPLPRLERMADFCEWGCAIAPAIGCDGDEFLGYVELNRKRLNQQTRESSAIIEPLRRFLLNNHRKFTGTAKTLLDAMNDCKWIADDYKHRKEWPSTASLLGRALRREADVLRDAGVELELDLHSSGASPKRIIRMRMPKRQKRQAGSGYPARAETQPRRAARRRR
ncbi:MAG: hypothetical protein KAI24_20515, partial [Planctomycetes bacterium]|nr:hypothetical protein [Planctomycetota bacterium]